MKDNKTKLENLVIEGGKKKNGGKLYDERQMYQAGTVFSACAIMAVLFDVIMIAYHIIRRNIEKGYPYLAQLLVILVVFAIASLGAKEPDLPKTLSGRSVPPERNRKAFLKRLLSCFLDSIVTVAVITALEIYADRGVDGDIVNSIAISFAVFMIIEVIVCEFRVWRWHEHQSKLDAEENDLED